MDLANWVIAGAAAGTFLLDPVINLVRNGRRARAYSRFNELLELREKAKSAGIETSHLKTATDEAVRVVRDRIIVAEMAFGLRHNERSFLARWIAWSGLPTVVLLSVLPSPLTGSSLVVTRVIIAFAIVVNVGLVLKVEGSISMAARRFLDDADANVPQLWPGLQLPKPRNSFDAPGAGKAASAPEGTT